MIHEIKIPHLNYRLFAATMRRNQVQMENHAPRPTSQCVALMDKLTRTPASSAKQLCKHTEATIDGTYLAWVNGV
jgi:hypothetical protein